MKIRMNMVIMIIIDEYSHHNNHGHHSQNGHHDHPQDHNKDEDYDEYGRV